MPPQAILTRNGDALELSLSPLRGTPEFNDVLTKIKDVPGRRYDPDKKVWAVPGEPEVAERVLHSIMPRCDAELREWVRLSRSKVSEQLTTKLPEDADLFIGWERHRAAHQPHSIRIGGEDHPFDGLMQHQRPVVDLAARKRKLIVADDMGLGKEQGIMTPVLTPNGWTTMGDLRPGDSVVGVDGLPTSVTNVFPQGPKALFRVTFSDGVSTLAGEEHLWLVKTPNDRARAGEWRVLTTEQLLPCHDVVGNRRWSIPLVSPVHFEQGDPLPIEPYLLGVLLGDGSISEATPGITCHHLDREIIERCRPLTKDILVLHQSSKCDYYSLVGTHARKALNGLGLQGVRSYEKFIPEVYLRASVPDRLALLQGLMDTDGYNQRGRGQAPATSAEISVSCVGLADGIQELVWSLGGTARRRIKKTSHRDSHRITVKLPPGINPFQHERKRGGYCERTKYPLARYIESIEYETTEEAVCISVSAGNGLYVTQDYIVTHNTATAISAVEEFRLRNPNDLGAPPEGPRLVICPNSVKGSWVRELKLWLGKEVPVQIVDATAAAKRDEQLREAVEGDAWAIVNWEQIRTTVEKRKLKNGGTKKVKAMKQPLFEKTKWLAVIADEVHRAKNRKAKQTEGLWRCRADDGMMLALSGTPLMNSPDELWPMLKWLWPKEYTAYWRFYDTYVDYYETHFGKVITGVKNPDALRFELTERLVRRTQGQVLTLPGKGRVRVPVELNPKQRKLYDEAEQAIWLEVEQRVADGDESAIKFAQAAAEGKSASELLRIQNGASRLVRLRQIIETPATLGGDDDSAVLDTCVDHIMDSRPEQWVVYCEFKATCDALVERLRKQKVVAEKYTGDVSPEDRTELEDKFQQGDIDCLVGTIETIYQGITLTAASKQFWCSRSWVPAKNEQGEDRQNRIGQTKRVQVFIAQPEDTVATDKVEPTNRLKEKIVKTVIPTDHIDERQALP